ncbi:threonine aldolase family protein [Achromobacter animicus]|uniref:threonine aldolase family protein n=1 Tax=Achromobacter animicus TaxID=1389935 RepID=UPI0028ABA9E5|nr:beta-eliminating lyase-related protein [Achromobacter animicus]
MVRINFKSDNVGVVAEPVLRAIQSANHGSMMSYGEDEISVLLNEKFSELFERQVTVIPVATGTAANAIALSCLARPWGAIYCHQNAHVHTSETGAAEFFSAGAKLLEIPGDHGKMSAQALSRDLLGREKGVTNRSQPDAVTLSQATERGSVYSISEMQEIGEIARASDLKFHVDGARFANAVATLRCTPADLTWRVGVDMLSFGVTKNGGMTADGIVVFDQALLEPLSYRLRRAGHTWSKMRFAAAQLLGYIEDGFFIDAATHANRLARRLADAIAPLEDCTILNSVEANIVFASVPDVALDALRAEDISFMLRPDGTIRLVTRFDMPESDIDYTISVLSRALSPTDKPPQDGR